jgi:hypothetical protein
MKTDTRSTGIEVGDIFRQYGPVYKERHRLGWQSLKAMCAIENCRTAALGGHVDKCDACGHERISYDSCCNRHCPKCQGLVREKWLAARQNELLCVTYFHVVLTIPCELNSIALVNQKVVYDILFKAGSETLNQLGHDPKHLGAEIGIIAVLHTWGQNLLDHPHLHCIVPGGGLSDDGKRWLYPKKSKKNKKFFVHINVISDLFKKKFLAYFKKAYRKGELKFVGRTQHLNQKAEFQKLLDQLYRVKWVTYCKPPFGGPEKVLSYLARYTNKVAISNHRIVKFEGGRVSFKWRDYRHGDKEKLMTLDVFEFIRRFLLHVLPFQYMRFRYYGLFSNRHRKTKISLCQAILGMPHLKEDDVVESKTWQDWLFELTGFDLRVCPNCGKGRMVRQEIILPSSHAPPTTFNVAA